MLSIILTLLFISLAAVFKAAADTMQHHFSTSVFKWWNPKFWDASISWQYAYYLRFTKYKVDGWHLANSGMIVSFCAAIVTKSQVSLHWFLQLLIAGAAFNIVFNLFYNKVLRK